MTGTRTRGHARCAQPKSYQGAIVPKLGRQHYPAKRNKPPPAGRATTRSRTAEDRWVPPRLRAALPNTAQASGGFDVRQLFGHLHQELARLAALDLVEGFHDANRPGGLHEAENALCTATRLTRCTARGPTAKEERNRYVERFGDTLQPAGADAVHPLFVLLHLLKGDPDPVRKLSLGETAFQPP